MNSFNKSAAKIEQLPPDQQDVLFNLEDEQAWTKSFAATTNEQWDKLAKMVRKDITEGQIFPLDDVFPPKQ